MDFSRLKSELTKIKVGNVIDKFNVSGQVAKHNLYRLFDGDGNEKEYFYTTISSSRLVYLCFYSWMKSNGGVSVKLEDGEPPVLFKSYYLEAKNEVESDDWPSNVDVLLVSEDSKILLYLESKFTEYISYAKDEASVSKAYFDDVELKALMADLVMRGFLDGKPVSYHRVISSTYPGGIKQMISHFVGVCKGPSPRDIDHETISGLWKGAERIYLGSIIYEFSDANFAEYCGCHKALADVLNAHCFGDKVHGNESDGVIPGKIKVIEQPFTYQELAGSNSLTEDVAEYYRLEEKNGNNQE
jgi:hypothetical protein